MSEALAPHAVHALGYWVNVFRKPHVRFADVVFGDHPKSAASSKAIVFATVERDDTRQAAVRTFVGEVQGDLLCFNKRWTHGTLLLEGRAGRDSRYYLLTPVDKKTVRVEAATVDTEADTKWTRKHQFSAAQPLTGLSANSSQEN